MLCIVGESRTLLAGFLLTSPVSDSVVVREHPVGDSDCILHILPAGTYAAVGCPSVPGLTDPIIGGASSLIADFTDQMSAFFLCCRTTSLAVLRGAKLLPLLLIAELRRKAAPLPFMPLAFIF